MDSPLRPPGPCPDLTHWKLGRHWHYPEWALLAVMGDRPAALMMTRWWPISRYVRRAR